MNSFFQQVAKLQRERGTVLCVGLDPDPTKIDGDVVGYLAGVIEATRDLVCCYKPNLAFFEALGLDGMRALDRVIQPIRGEIPIIADAKRGDVGHTAAAYARAMFEVMGVDAVTVSPYQGLDTLEPFLAYAGKGCIVLGHTSNPSSPWLQQVKAESGEPVYRLVARTIDEHNDTGAFGLVMGGTFPSQLDEIRDAYPELPILVPGIGAQGGELERTVAAARRGRAPIIVNVSRGILYGEGGAPGARDRVLEFNRRSKIEPDDG